MPNKGFGRKVDAAKVAVVSITFLFWVGLLLYWWKLAFRGDPTMVIYAEDYLWAWVFGLVALILAILGTRAKELPIIRLPAASRNIPQTVVISLALMIAFIFVQNITPFGFTQFFATEQIDLEKIGWVAALIIFGYTIPLVEESHLFGSWIQPSIAHTLQQLGFKKRGQVASVIAISFLMTAVMFSIFHLILGKINVGLLVMTFIFRIIMCGLNLSQGGYLPSLIIHTGINSATVGFALALPIYLWILPLVFVILPYFIIPKYSTAI